MRIRLLIQLNGYKIIENLKNSLWVSFGSYIFLGIYSINLKFQICYKVIHTNFHYLCNSPGEFPFLLLIWLIYALTLYFCSILPESSLFLNFFREQPFGSTDPLCYMWDLTSPCLSILK